MSNTWEYRFSFRIDRMADVPPEFESAYQELLKSEGSPLFGLFTPAIERSGIIKRPSPGPKVILVFQGSLAVLSLEDRSSHVSIFKERRKDISGCAMGNFLLNCWLALYPGRSPGERLEIQFPPQAFKHHQNLFRALLSWIGGMAETPPRHIAGSNSFIPGLPPKFSACLEDYPEVWQASEFFLQPAAQLHKDPIGRWANLLLNVNTRGVTVLSDLHRNSCSEYGVEMSFFPLRSAEKAEWIEPVSGSAARIALNLRSATVSTSLSWSVFSGLKPYGLRWIHAVNSEITNADQQIASDPVSRLSAGAVGSRTYAGQ